MNEPDIRKALHVVSNGSVAGCLKQALRLSNDRVLINEDVLHIGPAPAAQDLHAWKQIRGSFLNSLKRGYLAQMLDELSEAAFSFDGYSEVGLLMNAGRLGDEEQVLVWAAQGLHEQLLLAWVVSLVDRYGFDPSKLSVVQYTTLRPGQRILGMGELSPENIRDFNPGPHSLDAEELDELTRAWKGYTSADPTELSSYLARQTCLPLLHESMRCLLGRYPNVRSGLSSCDDRLLRNTVEHGPRLLKVIGYAMGENETPDQIGDDYLFHRLRHLGGAELSSPLVSFTGDIRDMRACSVEITDFGRRVLAGEANHVAENGIDDWIGGVHLKSGERVIYRDGDKLLPAP